MAQASAAKSEAECESWLQRIHELQTSRMTPERRSEIAMQVERSRCAEASRRKVKAVKSHVVRSNALVCEGLRQMEAASAPADYLEAQGRWSAAQQASSNRQEAGLSKMVALERADGYGGSEAVVMSTAEEDAEEDEGMAEAAALVGAAGPSLARAMSDEGGAEDQFEKLLEQLRNEPIADDEVTAKFGLYETYGEEVTKMRTTVFGLYDENEATLPSAVKNDMEHQLKKLDAAEAMGIPDDARGWFVFHMMRQAGRNNATMGSVMEHFEKKLEFLANSDQDECPICLEKFSAECPADTLGCCHKVCHECWTHWVAVMHGHPFCPLCKNDVFVETLHRRASA